MILMAKTSFRSGQQPWVNRLWTALMEGRSVADLTMTVPSAAGIRRHVEQGYHSFRASEERRLLDAAGRNRPDPKARPMH